MWGGECQEERGDLSPLFSEFWYFQMADVGTVTGPDYDANQVRVVVYHNFEAASQLQKISWLTEHCAGCRLPPSLWVRDFC